MTTNEAVKVITGELTKSNMSFGEALQGIKLMGIKNQKAIRIILTAISEFYVKVEGSNTEVKGECKNGK